jgi:hypothetical protein
MKKNILLFAVLLFAGTVQIMAQCTPDVNITQPLVPDSATNLPHAIAGVAYSTTIYLKVPASSVYQGFPVNVDSIQITSVTGLTTVGGTPNFSYVCDEPNCAWDGGSFGCILLTGSPTLAQARQNTTYSLVVNVMAYAKFQGFPTSAPYTADDYKIVIDTLGAGVADIRTNKFSVEQNTPNPFVSETNIEYTVSKAGPINFRVYNMLGKEVYNTQLRSEIGRNNVTYRPSNLNPGIYMYSIGNGKNSQMKRMIITN